MGNGSSTYIAVLVVTGLAAWWLSGFDSRLMGEGANTALIRRTLRCGITLILAGCLVPDLANWWRNSDPASGVRYLATSIVLAFVWCGCVSELCARGFHWLIEPHDNRGADLAKIERELDRLADLARRGGKEEAVRLCYKLKASGDYSGMALDAMLARLGAASPDTSRVMGKKPTLFSEAQQLRERGRFEAAESKLRTLLAKNRENPPAAMLLMRIYAQDLKKRKKAEDVLRQMEQQPYTPRDLVEYARRSLDEWSQEGSQARRAAPGIESLMVGSVSRRACVEEGLETGRDVDELLDLGYLGTAIEILEKKLKEHPENFDLALKFAEAHGHFCRNLTRAKKIVEAMEDNSAFSPDQVRQAKAKLEEWRAEAHPD